MKVSNRASGLVSVSLKLDSATWEEFTVVVWQLSRRIRISKAEVLSVIVKEWVEKQKVEYGEDVISAWIGELKEAEKRYANRVEWLRQAARELRAAEAAKWRENCDEEA